MFSCVYSCLYTQLYIFLIAIDMDTNAILNVLRCLHTFGTHCIFSVPMVNDL